MLSWRITGEEPLLYVEFQLTLNIRLAGNLIRWWFGSTLSNDLLSEESLARSQYERDLAVQKSQAAVESSELEDVVEKFDLKPDDFIDLYDSICRAGIEHDDALRAMINKRVVEWYFENKGKEGKFSEGESLKFTLIVKNSL